MGFTPEIWLIIALALVFDFINGFHDAANSIATVVSTRVLSPGQAVAWAAFFNFIAAFGFGTAVASTVGKGMVDLSIVVWTPRAVQLARLVARDQLSPAEAEGRLAAQMPLDDKATLADVVVVNDGPRAALAGKAARLLADIRAGLPRRLPNAAPARY